MRLDHLLSKGKEVEAALLFRGRGILKVLVSIRVGDTPVPIPNTTVKPYAAEGTLLETARESRWMPKHVGV